MEYHCNIKIIDSIMGSGKTSAAINYINSSSPDERFLIITPYLTEVSRYKESCPSRNFREPVWKNSRKIDSLKDLISKRVNIVSTHALFQRFDLELIDICRAANYTLIMDEVANVVEEYYITQSDYDIIMKDLVYVEEETNLITWREDQQNYRGEFSDIKRLCELKSLAQYSGSIIMWLFPVEVFNSFRNIFILTYMFSAQLQCYYYNYYKLPYTYAYVGGESVSNYHFSNSPRESTGKDYSSLIHILSNDKMNMIGDRQSDLSKTWFERNKNNVLMKQLKNNLLNFFRNIRCSSSEDNIWTTFKEYKGLIQGKGYTKAFVSINTRSSNNYKDRTAVAYIANRYMNPLIKNFFVHYGIQVDEDNYALSEMLQWIWRSAIREDKEIWIYVPSIRMRTLLANWIKNFSGCNDNSCNDNSGKKIQK